MSRYSELNEAKELLQSVESWSEDEIEELPKLYQRKVRMYRGLLKDGD